MEKRIAASCGIGTALFVAIALLFAPAYWPLALLCGAAGGAVGVYMGYDPIGVIRAIPIAWKRSIQEGGAGIARVIAWFKRPRPFAYANWIITGLFIMSLAALFFSFRLITSLLGYGDSLGYGDPDHIGSILAPMLGIISIILFFGYLVALELRKEKLTTEAKESGWGFHAGVYEQCQEGALDPHDYQTACHAHLRDAGHLTEKERDNLRYDIPSQARIVWWCVKHAMKIMALGVGGLTVLLPLAILIACITVCIACIMACATSLWLLPGAIFLASRWICRFTALVCKNLFVLIHCKAHTTCLIYMMGAGTTTAVYAWTAHPEITWSLYGFFVGCSSVLGAGAGIFAREVVAKRLLHLPIPK